MDGVAQMVARVSRTGMLAEVASLESAAAAEEQLLREQQPRPAAQAASSLPKVRLRARAPRPLGRCWSVRSMG